jgi:hypothetical protein
MFIRKPEPITKPQGRIFLTEARGVYSVGVYLNWTSDLFMGKILILAVEGKASSDLEKMQPALIDPLLIWLLKRIK